jgi:hypothetical protein
MRDFCFMKSGWNSRICLLQYILDPDSVRGHQWLQWW